MDEIKNNVQQNMGGEGGRKRRKKHRRHGGHNPNQNAQNSQNVDAVIASGARQSRQSTQQNQTAQNNQKPQQKNGNANHQKGGKPNNAQNNQKGVNNVQKGQKQMGQPPKNQEKPQQQAQNNQKQKQQNQNTQTGQSQKQKNKNQTQNGKKDTYLYVLDGNLYVNLTNKCSNGCDFCVRNERDSYYGYNLWLKNGDPTAEKVIAAANAMDLSKYKEAVFCGFGEPTYKVNEMLALCDFFHAKGISTRLNTNGQGNLINKRDIVPDLKGKIDFVNISLNFSCAEKYQPVCRSQYGASGFEAILEFARQCRRNDVACRFSIVDCIGEDEVEACKRLAESMHVPLYVRSYITDS